MMSMQSALNTLVTADSPKGLRAVETFRAQYNKARLSDEDAQTLNESGAFAAHIAEGIRKFSPKRPVFPVYLEIEVGDKSKDELLAEIVATGMTASYWAQDIMSQPAWTSGNKEAVKFARVNMRELGFTKKPTTRDIWARIQKIGHALCKPGDGPAIRLALKGQPCDDAFWITMEQIAGSNGNSYVFCVTRHFYGEAQLDASWIRPDPRWDLEKEMVFRLCK